MFDTHSEATQLSTLDEWHKLGVLRAIDLNLGTLLIRSGASERLAVVAALVSYQVGRGHTCLSLAQLFQNPRKTLGVEDNFIEFEAQFHDVLPNLADIQLELQENDSVRCLAAEHGRDQLQPLVWDASRQLLYLRRYWQYEHRIAAWLKARTDEHQQPVSAELLAAIIDKLIARKADGVSWQRVACANAAKQMFSVITGGPGTGKTYTVVRVLATLLALNEDLRIALAAPTGKAAARMDESVNAALNEAMNQDHPEALERVRLRLKRKASTLHRLLGSQRNSRYFRHNSTMPLPYDVVVVDEASMIDTEMFDALLDAIGPNTRLILLGDKDQLAPVEAGSILASLCNNAEQRRYSAAHRQWLMQASGEKLPEQGQDVNRSLSDHIVMLEGSERFKGAIADIANAVNACNVADAEKALTAINTITPPAMGSDPDIRDPSVREFWRQLSSGFNDFVEQCNAVVSGDEDAVNAWTAGILSAYSNYQLLTALRAGPWGQQQINLVMEQIFRRGGGSWYHGRPVIVTSNDYSLNLNNGDIGVVLKHPSDQTLRVAFPAPVTASNPHGVRWILPSRLASVETVYAMTVHKSQGSEFRHAVLILPDRPTPVLTKELIYTGITRAKVELTLVIPNKRVWQQGITQRIERLGGLSSALT